MAISQIMRRDLVTLDMDSTLSDAKSLFELHDMHHILITDNGKLTGVINDRDLLQHLSPTIGTRKESPQDSFILNKKIHLIMCRDVISASDEITLNEAVLMFYDHKISCIPVISKEEKPIGIVTWRDIIKIIAVQYRRKAQVTKEKLAPSK
ncbi:CBS domain-containing protein [Cognaticolwellia mytili]|uniref:CBS domain-containing protein n=1 Tax=Cognaticolwellia mytili TaxID=1888913 RepID=UPI000A16E6A8|nr:CBS domain-containing protein [Cognaticolwellia mytili]